MKVRMKLRVLYIGMVVLLLFPHLIAQSTETTTIIIYIDTTGSALWIVETRLVLTTREDEELFDEFQKDETLKEGKLSDFKERMNLLLEKIKYSKQRSMNMTDFDIFMGKETTVTKTYGVIQLRFLWEGFAVKKDDTIIMGDVFEGGYYLSRNEILIVELPDNYHVETVSPSPDQQKRSTLIWEGPMNFVSGEPAVTIEKDVVQQSEKEEEILEQEKEEEILEQEKEEEILEPENGKAVLIASGLGLLLIPALIIAVTRKKKQKEEPQKLYLDDKNLVIETIRNHGGSIAQKELPGLTGFSKAKISILLNELKEEGLIRKTFRGRENLITLNEGNLGEIG
ncbi:MAG: hypothetical protein HXS44_06545 [Theionarchaea archaeon]|nr:hypothetical protein [Theionarchaea archaeon]